MAVAVATGAFPSLALNCARKKKLLKDVNLYPNRGDRGDEGVMEGGGQWSAVYADE